MVPRSLERNYMTLLRRLTLDAPRGAPHDAQALTR